MIALLKKELIHFFSSAIGYVFISFFLGVTGLFLWVLHGEFNITDSGFASLAPFFELAPWVFLLLIPAACMQSFADERKQGTLELLLTKPISTFQLVLGKYLGICSIVFLALVPTLIYVIALYNLAMPVGEIDFGSIIGSYISLLLLGSTYAAIGIFASSLTQNQTVALLISLLLCFLAYFGLANLGESLNIDDLESLGIDFHYNRMGEGVIDTRDVIYFITFCGLFLGATYFVFRKQNQVINYKKIGFALVSLIALNFMSTHFYERFDLTQDKRFSLSDTTLNLLEKIQTPISIDVLLDGNLPPEFRKLQRETKQLLSTFAAENKNIKFAFTDPLESKEYRAQSLEELQRLGLTPAEVSTQFDGVLKKEVVIPWALAYFNKKSVKVPLMKNNLGATTAERTNASIQNLEYAFSDALKQLTSEKNKTVAVVKGNGQLDDIYLADYVKTLQQYYRIAPFVLDTLAPNKTLENLKKFDLVINAKPTQRTSDIQKLILDQHLMSGKSQLLLLDQVAAEKDSLFTNPNFTTLAWNRDTNLNDMLFAYGVRINPQLINDYYSAPIVLANGEGSNTQYTPYTWGFSSLSQNNENHPISTNLGKVKFNFASPIDTLKNKTKKTVLLKSSPFTRLQGVPSQLNLANITREQQKEKFSHGNQNLAVLLEGNFKSTYKDRILPFETPNFIKQSTHSKFLIISDGDIIKNEIAQQQPLELGFDPITQQSYANKEFLLNAANYLLGDFGLVSLRAKQINIPIIDLDYLSKNKLFWQIICLVFPWLLCSLGYVLFFIYRRKKFTN